jgi:predicted GNAT family N-acyltransferase
VIEYSASTPIAATEVLPLLRQTAWGAGRTEADLAKALGASAIHVGAWSDGKLVGFARAITDGVYRGFIEDVVVDESLRGRGVGRRLVRELLQRCAHVDVVALDCPNELVSFYAELGFAPSANTRMEIIRARHG